MIRNEHGFTLIEMIGVLIILAVIASVGMFYISRNKDLADKAAIETKLQYLNTLEQQTYFNYRLEGKIWEDDEQIFELVKSNLDFQSKPIGGVYRGIELTRILSTNNSPAIWRCK